MADQSADSLRDIQAALEKEFSPDAAVAECCAGAAVHLVYAHLADPVMPDAQVPLDHPDFDERAGSFPWTTPPKYEASTAPRYNQPYRDFIAARLSWKQLADVSFEKWPTGATEPEATADDGGTLIEFEGGSARSESELTVEVPEATELPGDYPEYPSVRRVCLSVPGTEGVHAEINSPENDTNSATLAYPAPGADDSLRLLAVTPHFQFEIRPDAGGKIPIEDPWEYRICYGVTPAEHYTHDLYEISTGQRVGGITRYDGRYGIVNDGAGSAATLRAEYLDNPTRFSPSRALLIDTILKVEGGPAAVTTYDGPKLSWGMNQFNIPDGGTGELHQILCYIYDFFPDAFEKAFGRYGIGIWFNRRSRVWSAHTTYGEPKLFRLPCCDTGLPAKLDAITADLSPAESYLAMATQFALRREDTTTAAMIYIFHRAGLVPDIQKAQLQWTSYRVTRSLDGVDNPTVRGGLRPFLRSLGSNMSDADREANANAAFEAARERGVTTDPDGAFSDEGGEAEWYDWAVRCENAGKEVSG